MKIGKIAILAAVVLAVVMFGSAAYCFLGGADPSRDMGNYRSFSFYADRPGNSAAIWMQSGAAPPNPWDEFWFDNSGNFNLPGGLRTPGPVSIGATGYFADGAMPVNIKAFGAKGDGTTDDTTALQNAINATPAGGTLYIPPASVCYKFSTLTIPNAIRIEGDGYSDSNTGVLFGGSFSGVVTGSVLCSTNTSGRAIDWDNTQEGGSIDNIFVLGPGANGSVISITACQQCGSTVTGSAVACPGSGSTNTLQAECTVASTSGLAVGMPIYISGESESEYNGSEFVNYVDPTHFDFELRDPQPVNYASGTGGTVTPESSGISFGDQSHYASGLSVNHTGVADFGIGAIVHAQNCRFSYLDLEGNGQSDILNESRDAYGNTWSVVNGLSNDNLFSRLTCLWSETPLDWPFGSQSNLFEAFMIGGTTSSDGSGNKVASTTAKAIYLSNGDSDNFFDGYVEDAQDPDMVNDILVTGSSSGGVKSFV